MRELIQLKTHRDQELVDITEQVRAIVARSGIRDGLVQVYAQGAKAAIMIQVGRSCTCAIPGLDPGIPVGMPAEWVLPCVLVITAGTI